MSNLYISSRLTALMIVALLFLQLPAQAASLWNDSSAGANLYGDKRAHNVGDIITIIISETSTAARSGSANNSKTSAANVNAGTGLFSGIASASAGNSDSFKAQGTITNSNIVTGRLTVAITEVKPNGNLVVSGTQSIKQNNEEQKITVTGEVRAEDITPDNTILSSLVANAQIKIDGKGPIAGKQRQGIVTQVFNFLF